MMRAVDTALVEALTDLASKAAAAILSIPRASLKVRSKPDHSPLTAADSASDAVIFEGLSRLLPGVPVVSEESAGRPTSIAPGASFVLVDPLDGTKEFVADRDDYTVNLAFVIDGRPKIGVVAVPARGLIFRGMMGGAAERLTLAAGAAPELATEIATLKTRVPPRDGLCALVSRSHLDSATERYLERLAVHERVPCGSALKFCQIAAGNADLYARLSPTSEWDIAAGHAVLAAAGGTVMAVTRDAMVYGHASAGFRVPGFVAWGDPTTGLAAPNP